MPQDLTSVLSSTNRMVVGVMSGTSLDGIDIVTAELSGSAGSLSWRVIGSDSIPYGEALVQEIRINSEPSSSSVDAISLLNVRLAHEYADAIRTVLDAQGILLESIDVIGIHGQTVFHQSEPTQVAGKTVTATLQLGDPSTLANLLGRIVIGDFRMADMALGGQGAPLVPYFDVVCFKHATENRMGLNLGGIANVTVIPAGSEFSDVTAFDTGPSNMIIDGVCRALFDQPFDDDGSIASTGTPDREWISKLLSHPYFGQAPPKSTGRELFSPAYVECFLEDGKSKGLSRNDIVATATELTVQSITDAYRRFIEPISAVNRIIASGGGVHNSAIMDGLRRTLDGMEINTIADFGVDPDTKEALCFAILAHETLNGMATNVPSATGARQSTLLGKICVPG